VALSLLEAGRVPHVLGTEEEAASLRRLLGTEAPQESGNPLLEWLGNLLGI